MCIDAKVRIGSFLVGSAAVMLAAPDRAGAQEYASGRRPLTNPYTSAEPAPEAVRRPSALPLADYETILYAWLNDRAYLKLGWAVDRGVRDTGPYLLGESYGVHPAVRIVYSPEVIDWLVGGRRGAIADGAVIIKEMFTPPAARYQELAARYADDPAGYEAALQGMLSGWTVLIKDRRVGTKDGWFWSNPSPGYPVDGYGPPFAFPASGLAPGTCLRCHASAEKESTFSSLNNIAGFEGMEGVGDPLRYRVDESWRTDLSPFQRPALGTDGAALVSDFVTLHLPDGLRPEVPEAVPPLTGPDPTFLATFPPIRDGGGRSVTVLPPAMDHVQAFPGQWADRVPPATDGAQPFITSDNCIGCHGGLGGAPAGVTMFVQTGAAYGDGYNVSEFGEWRWSPMGLAGRDPIFYAQLESEFAILADDAKRHGLFPVDQLEETQQAVANTCLSCHGAMGQRQLGFDHARDRKLDPNFYVDYVQLTTPLTAAAEEEQRKTEIHGHSAAPYHRYGNLAREGISCTICHHIAPPTTWTDGMERNDLLSEFLMHSTTGVFPVTDRDKLSGPFADVKPKPMENALGITPVQSPLVPGTKTPYIQDSKMCGTCHVINLPNVDAAKDRPLDPMTRAQQAILNRAGANGAAFLTEQYGLGGEGAKPWPERLTGLPYSIEQATYLEWENSDFAWDEGNTQSCQDCHMPGGFRSLDGAVDVPQLVTPIATIEDSTYPATEGSLSDEDVRIKVRDDYRRHELVGLNAFLLEMFDQFDELLGIDESDYMTGATNGNQLAIDNMLRQGREQTVALGVTVTDVEANEITARVDVTNKVGHRFPSGVGFRRAFLEVVAVQTSGGVERVVWGSGRTNSVGVIVDGDGDPLKTEFLDQKVAGRKYALFQPHYDRIDAEDQVQIYEELVVDARDEFTTSFIHRDHHPKDNRLLPFGYLDPDSKAFEERFSDETTTPDAFAAIQAFMVATTPEAIGDDPNFGPGRDAITYVMSLPWDVDPRDVTVKATMHYQAIPPYWLQQRFSLAPDGPATQRLYFLTSHLNTAGTAIEDWKLPLVTATAAVRDARLPPGK